MNPFAPGLGKRNGRPSVVKAVIAIQALTAVAYTCLGIYMLKLEAARGWTSSRFYLLALAGFTVIVPWLILVGLANGKPWGRGLALFFALLNIIAIVGGNHDRHTWPARSETAIGLFFILFSTMFFLRPMRQFFQRPK